jgi:hypothetical protein
MRDRCCRVVVLVVLLPLSAAAGVDQAARDGVNVNAAAPSASASPAAADVAKALPMQALPPPTALETQAGVQIVHVGPTAAGGLVDVRLKVLDAAKASALLADPANTPSLVVADKPPLMASHHALKGARFSDGQVIFILLPNVRGAVQAGVPVTIAMGPVRLGPVTAQ